MKKLIEDLGAIIEEAGDLTEVKKRSSVQRRKSEKSRKKAVSKSMEAKKASPEQEALLDSIWGVIDGKHRQIEGALEINWGYDFPDMGTGYVERDDPLINMGASATTDDMDDAAEHFADGSEVEIQLTVTLGPHRNGKDLFMYASSEISVTDEGDREPDIIGNRESNVTVKIPARTAAKATSVNALGKILPLEKLKIDAEIDFPDWDDAGPQDDGDAKYDAWKDAGKPPGGPGRWRSYGRGEDDYV